MNTEEANSILPQKPTKAIANAAALKYLTIAPPKWGKTTLACSCPDSILLAFEEGHAFHETHKIVIDAWDRPYSERKEGWLEDGDGNKHTGFLEAVEVIVSSDRFQMVVIDTADMAAKMCLDYHYAKLGVSHASDAGDYGKGWDLCLTQPFRRAVGQLMKAGRGIFFITHTNIVEKTVGKEKVTRHESTLPSQVQKFLHTQADVIMHGTFGRKRKGMLDRDRIIVMDGSNEILAGSRVRGLHVPAKFVVDPEKPWDQWAGFFTDPDSVDAAEEFYRINVLKGKEAEDEQKAEIEAAPAISPDAPAPEETATASGNKKGQKRSR